MENASQESTSDDPGMLDFWFPTHLGGLDPWFGSKNLINGEGRRLLGVA
jgi:hypothetical protein